MVVIFPTPSGTCEHMKQWVATKNLQRIEHEQKQILVGTIAHVHDSKLNVGDLVAVIMQRDEFVEMVNDVPIVELSVAHYIDSPEALEIIEHTQSRGPVKGRKSKKHHDWKNR